MREYLDGVETDRAGDPAKPGGATARGPLARRFYEKADAVAAGDCFAVVLDGRPVRTPRRRPLELATEAAAKIVAAEWAAQGENIDPATMPATRLANTAIDGVADDPQAVAEDILKFASADLLFYRADAPAALVERQSHAWDPVIDWYRDEVGANFILAEGIVHVAQPREAIAAFGARLRLHSGPVRLACLHTFTTLTGSALLALAVAGGWLSAGDAWTAAHVDEDWNIAQWGEDAEAAARRALRWAEMKAAADLLAALDAP